MDSTVIAARAALHMWEEPCISGEKGSGQSFFPDAACGAASARIIGLPKACGRGDQPKTSGGYFYRTLAAGSGEY